MAKINIINTQFSMPSGIGSAGQAILSDGAGGSTFGSPSASKFINTTGVNFVAAVQTLLATFMDNRIIMNTNVGPCTWTADTGTNYTNAFPGLSVGDTLVVYVGNTTGATIGINGAANVSIVGGTPFNTSANLLLRYGGGISWDIYII